MAEALNFTLLPEGSSDSALLPILRWVLGEHVSTSTSINGNWVQEDRLPIGKIGTPRDRLRSAVDVYPCHLLFIHRDEDGDGWDRRANEIAEWLALAELGNEVTSIPVIPIQTSETWLLIDEGAIRRAAGNPNGNASLNLPSLRKLEGLADPKQALFDTLLTASELSGRRRKKFNKFRARSIVGKHMTKRELLRELSAFQRLEKQIIEVCQRHQWT